MYLHVFFKAILLCSSMITFLFLRVYYTCHMIVVGLHLSVDDNCCNKISQNSRCIMHKVISRNKKYILPILLINKNNTCKFRGSEKIFWFNFTMQERSWTFTPFASMGRITSMKRRQNLTCMIRHIASIQFK